MYTLNGWDSVLENTLGFYSSPSFKGFTHSPIQRVPRTVSWSQLLPSTYYDTKMNTALLPGTINPVQKQTLVKMLTHFHVPFCFSIRTLHHGVKSYPVYCSGFFAEHKIHFNFNYCYMLGFPLAKPIYFNCYSLLQTFTVILNIWHFP